MKLYKFLYTLIVPILRLLYRIRIIGRENIPDRAVVVCGNHTSFLDPLFLCVAFGKGELLTFMAKQEIFKVPVIGSVLRGVGAIPVNRGATEISTLRNAIDTLRSGKKLMIFPEGTRVKGDEASVEGAKTGAAMIACRAKEDMLPVYITAKKRVFGRVDVIIGKPIEIENYEGSGSARYRAVIESVFEKILALGKGI